MADPSALAQELRELANSALRGPLLVGGVWLEVVRSVPALADAVERLVAENERLKAENDELRQIRHRGEGVDE